MGCTREFREERILNFPAGYILYVQYPALGVSAFSPEIRLTMAGNLPLVEAHSDLLQFPNRFRSFGHDCAHHLLVTKSGAGIKCVANMQFEGILTAGHASNAALGPCRIRVAPLSFCNYSHGTLPGSLECKAQTRDSASDYDKIEFLHAISRLSINRVPPMKTARARTAFGRNVCSGSKVSASIKLT